MLIFSTLLISCEVFHSLCSTLEIQAVSIFCAHFLLISFHSRHSQKASLTSWLAATSVLCRSLVVFWCDCTVNWRSSTWTGTGRWRCSRCFTPTGVALRSTAAFRMASATSLFEERCWMMSCFGNPPSTGPCQKGFHVFMHFFYMIVLSIRFPQLHVHRWKLTSLSSNMMITRVQCCNVVTHEKVLVKVNIS